MRSSSITLAKPTKQPNIHTNTRHGVAYEAIYSALVSLRRCSSPHGPLHVSSMAPDWWNSTVRRWQRRRSCIDRESFNAPSSVLWKLVASHHAIPRSHGSINGCRCAATHPLARVRPACGPASRGEVSSGEPWSVGLSPSDSSFPLSHWSGDQ
jgi:hypothetical protein